jgi:hypothetical protein
VNVPLELDVPISKSGPSQFLTPKVTSPRRLTVVPLARPVRAKVSPAVMVKDSMLGGHSDICFSKVPNRQGRAHLIVVQARLDDVTSEAELIVAVHRLPIFSGSASGEGAARTAATLTRRAPPSMVETRAIF